MSTVDMAALLERNYATISALCIIVWDFATTMGDETQFIWRGPVSTIKALYLLARYMPLVAQVVSSYFTLGPLSRLIPVQYETCFAFTAFAWTAAHILFTVLVAVVMMRINAMYHQDRKISITLSSLFTVHSILSAVLGYRILQEMAFDGTCNVINKPRDLIYLGIAAAIDYVILLKMMLMKKGINGSLFLNPKLRDWKLRLTMLAGIVTTGISIMTQPKDNVTLPYYTFIWSTSLISIITCRFIIMILKKQGTREAKQVTEVLAEKGVATFSIADADEMSKA